jgi:hypothetical protein
MTPLFEYLRALALHNPGALFGLLVLFSIVCMALFTPEERGGNGW